jgi:hypothetical protein|tara:strand:- start:1817 stop:2173 length:357 start_codon:yes stop_codon:yes gene_type:complete
MVNTNTKTNSQPTKLGVYLPQSITNATAANAWCATHGIKFSQLVIGKGTNPNHPLVVNPTTASNKRKRVLLNNAMVGQTVAQYYNQVKAKLGMQKPSTNNPVYANAKLQLITLHLPSK